MKKSVIFIVTAAAAVATLFSCTRELSDDVNTASFTASFPEDATKTAIQPYGTSVWWTGEESINVFTSSGKSAKFTSEGSGARATAEFTGSFSGSTDGDTFYAVYPYNEANSFSEGKITLTVPTQQTAVEGSFADNLFPSMAVSDNDVFRFYHVCGGFRFTLSQEGIRRITLEAIGGETLAGKAAVSFGEGDRPVAELVKAGLSCIALNAPEGTCFKTGTWYYMVALPTELSGGYELSFYKEGSWGSKAYSSTVTIKRGVFGSRQNVDSGVSFTNYETVDLGLPSGTLWSTFNIGATSCEEYGDYYAWGESEPKSNYVFGTYKLCNGTSSQLTKYCVGRDSQYWGGSGTPDEKLQLDPEDDAAHVNWGEGWRIPTEDIWRELVTNCDYVWTMVNGVNGFLLTSKSNNATLFLPAAGDREGKEGTRVGDCILYWSATLESKVDSRGAGCTNNSSTHLTIWTPATNWNYRSAGLSVRPVFKK